MTHMVDADARPIRRWFQFRLSTWFVLVALLAWIVAVTEFEPKPIESIAPHALSLQIGLAEPLKEQISIVHIVESVPSRSLWPDYRKHEMPFGVENQLKIELIVPRNKSASVFEIYIRPVTALLWPALALTAFIGWKAAWAIGRRVKGRKVEQA